MNHRSTEGDRKVLKAMLESTPDHPVYALWEIHMIVDGVVQPGQLRIPLGISAEVVAALIISIKP